MGDTILLERKTTKANSPYDPQPYTAEAVHGTQIVGRRGEERKVRYSQKWKWMEIRPVQQAAGGADHGQGRGCRGRWSISPLRTWTERPSRPLTQSVAGRRQREGTAHSRGNADGRGEETTLTSSND